MIQRKKILLFLSSSLLAVLLFSACGTPSGGGGDNPLAPAPTPTTAPTQPSPTAAPVTNVFGPNLIINGDAEAAPAAKDDQSTASVPGWQSTGYFTTVEYGSGGGFPANDDPGPKNRGKNFFAGGPESFGGKDLDNTTVTATQMIDLSLSASVLDKGKVQYTLSAYLGGYGGQEDSASLSIEFLKSDSTPLAKPVTIGPVSPAASDLNGKSGMVERHTSGVVPVGTRFIKVTMTMKKESGAYNDGYADNLSLTLQNK